MKPYIKEYIKTTIEKIKNTSKKVTLLSAIELGLVFFITILYYLTLSMESKRVVFIPKGSTSNALSYLNQNGYSLNFIDRISLLFIGYPQSGWMDMGLKSDTTKLTKLDFLYKISTSKAALATVTLLPGETYYFFLNELATKLKLPRDELFKAYHELAYKKDGNIISQTYNLPIGMNPRDLLLYLFQYTQEEYQKYSTKIFNNYHRDDWYKYIIIASIIQKESGSKMEMTQVSGVIYNRLAQKMKLQMDGTLNYGEFSHTRVTPTMIANDETTYNTYKFYGIPTDPVCAVEFEAIKAAIFPAKNSYLFFMKKVGGGGHSFASNFESHKINIATTVAKEKELKKTSDLESKTIQKVKSISKQEIKSNNQLDKTKNKPIKNTKEVTNLKVYDKLHQEKKKQTDQKQKTPKELWKNI